MPDKEISCELLEIFCNVFNQFKFDWNPIRFKLSIDFYSYKQNSKLNGNFSELKGATDTTRKERSAF
mgnify:CR=1 FL=1